MSKRKGHRVADDITAGMKAIVKMIAGGKAPTDLFTARTVEIADPPEYAVAQCFQNPRAKVGGERQYTHTHGSALDGFD